MDRWIGTVDTCDERHRWKKQRAGLALKNEMCPFYHGLETPFHPLPFAVHKQGNAAFFTPRFFSSKCVQNSNNCSSNVVC